MRTARRWKLDSFARAANRQAIIPLPALAGVAKGAPRAESRRAGAARDSDHHQRDFGGAAE